MTRARLLHLLLFRLLPLLVIGLLGTRALAQADPPSRVGRLNHTEGPVAFSPAGDNEWIDAALNRPLTRGDRVWTDKRSRAEMQVGSSAVRLDGQTHLEILALDDQSTQLSITQGTVYLRVRSLPEGENFEIDTPNLAYRAAYPGDYRIDVDAANGTTRVTIHSGTGVAYGEGGQVQPLGGGQQVTFRTRTLAQVAAQESPPQDNFDRWANERNRREDQSVAARYVPREVVGYQHLDAHGQWAQDATHGTVWFPQNLAANWAPYRHGHWEWIAPWGWTWIDNAPWGFAPSHYGRWAVIGSRWAWVPGRIGLKPVYAPALVAFVGGGNGSNWITAGRPGVAWFPLAPGEAWLPAYPASPVYLANMNRNFSVVLNASHAHQRNADALTAISAEDFNRGKPARAGWLRIAANTLTSAQVIAPPPKPEASANTRVAQAPAARATPPAQAQARQEVVDAPVARQAQAAAVAASQAQVAGQVAAQAQARAQAQALAQQQADATRVRLAAEQKQAEAAQAQAQAQAQTQAQRAQQPKPDAKVARNAPAVREPEPRATAQPKTVESVNPAVSIAKPVAPPQINADEQAKLADQARRAELAKAAEKSRRETTARAAEQGKADKLAKRAELSRRDQLARRAEQSRREQSAKQAEAAKREQLARREQEKAAKRDLVVKREQARRELQARRAEQVKAETMARRAEQARREAVARRDEQQRREAHAQQVEQARRAADRDAQVLAEQRQRREEQQARREAQERDLAQLREREKREEAQREASARQQQALAEQWRRDRQVWEQQQQQRVRQRPDLRDDRRSQSTEPRSIPILNAGPMS